MDPQVLRDRAFSASLNGIRAIQMINSHQFLSFVGTGGLRGRERRDLDEVAKMLVNETYDYEGYRQRLSIAALAETLGLDHFASWIPDISHVVGRSSSDVVKDLNNRIVFMNEMATGKKSRVVPSSQVEYVSYCATSQCTNRYRCLFQFSQDFLDILSIPSRCPNARQVGECVRRAQGNNGALAKEALEAAVMRAFSESQGKFGWPTRLGGKESPDPVISVSILEFVTLSEAGQGWLSKWAAEHRVFDKVLLSLGNPPWESVIVNPETAKAEEQTVPDKSLSVTMEICRGLMNILRNKGNVEHVDSVISLLGSGLRHCLEQTSSGIVLTHTYGRDRYFPIGKCEDSDVRGAIELAGLLVQTRRFMKDQRLNTNIDAAEIPRRLDESVNRVVNFQDPSGFWPKISNQQLENNPEEFRDSPAIYNWSFFNTCDAITLLLEFMCEAQNPFCPSCGGIYDLGAEFCTKCGKKLA